MCESSCRKYGRAFREGFVFVTSNVFKMRPQKVTIQCSIPAVGVVRTITDSLNVTGIIRHESHACFSHHQGLMKESKYNYIPGRAAHFRAEFVMKLSNRILVKVRE